MKKVIVVADIGAKYVFVGFIVVQNAFCISDDSFKLAR